MPIRSEFYLKGESEVVEKHDIEATETFLFRDFSDGTDRIIGIHCMGHDVCGVIYVFDTEEAIHFMDSERTEQEISSFMQRNAAVTLLPNSSLRLALVNESGQDTGVDITHEIPHSSVPCWN